MTVLSVLSKKYVKVITPANKNAAYKDSTN